MARKVTIPLEIEDKFSAPLRKFADAAMYAEREAERLGKATDKAQRGMGGLAGVAGQVAAGLGLSFGIAQVASLMLDAGKASLQLAMNMEQTRIGFTTLTGSAENAQKHLDELRDFASRTPFTFTDLTEASKRMMALGFETEKVIPTLTILGDTAAALNSGSVGINRMSLALGQMNAKGRLSTQEMNQLTEAGVNGWKYVAAELGVTEAALRKMTEKGLVPADVAIKAILEGMQQDFGGLMAAQAETAAGKISNLTDAFERLGTAVGEQATPSLGFLAGGLGESINNGVALTEALNRGIITAEEYGNTQNRLATFATTTGEVQEWLKYKTEEYSVAANEASRETQRFTFTAGEFTTALVTLNQELPLTKEQLDANKDSISQLNTLMAGAVGKELRSYGDQQTELKDKAAELKTEIEKLEAAQGRQFTTQTNNGLSAAELTLAHEKLSVAQTKLSETTDPLKQAQLAVEIEKLQGKIAGASTSVSGYIDNSKKIGELSSEYDDVNKALDENATKHEDATKRILFDILKQEAAVGGFTDKERDGLISIAEKWGLVDSATATSTREMITSLDNLANDGSLADFEADVDRSLGKLLGWPSHVSTSFSFIDAGAGDVGLPGGDSGVYNPTPDRDTTPSRGAGAAGGTFWDKPMVVGEHGPEVWTPPSAGGSLASSTQSAGGMTFGNINVDARGSTLSAREIEMAVERALETAGRRADIRGRTG